MDKKKIIITILILIVVILGGMVITKLPNSENKQEKEEIINKIATKKKTDKYEIYNTNIKSEHGKTEITATVKNITENTTEEEMITIVLIDESGNEIGKVTTVIPILQSEKTTNITAQNLTEYKNIYDFKIQ